MAGRSHFLRRRSDPPEADQHEERVRAYTAALLAETREELARADQKAAILLAAAGVVIGALFASLLGGGGQPEGLGPLWRALWWGGALTALLGAGCFGFAVLPRTVHRAGRTEIVGFYGDVAAYADDGALLRALAVSSDHTLDRVVSQLRAIAHIVVLKYRLVRWGILLFGASVLCQAVVLAFA
ncbi:Pycsar system effector family protein [Nocardiopsis sp. LOL_012]|uniref:Pycsar system effector family protein n=1 Tax=Nocardiopsis sp. LOL_012 TaxID=3345409 RepID=UPI003A84DFFA